MTFNQILLRLRDIAVVIGAAGGLFLLARYLMTKSDATPQGIAVQLNALDDNQVAMLAMLDTQAQNILRLDNRLTALQAQTLDTGANVANLTPVLNNIIAILNRIDRNTDFNPFD